jgi:predicted DNA-binding transcriptional regulator
LPSTAPDAGDPEDRRKKAESQLKGNTLRVYVYVVTHRKSGVREIQRALHFSSSSLAQYHLTKLLELGLVHENGGEYSLAEEVKADVLKDFLRVGTFIVPRFIFYAVFFTIVTAFLAFELFYYAVVGLAGIDYLLIAMLGCACGLFWYEALRAWIKGPL